MCVHILFLFAIYRLSNEGKERSFATDVHSPAAPSGSFYEHAKDSAAELVHRMERALKETAATVIQIVQININP